MQCLVSGVSPTAPGVVLHPQTIAVPFVYNATRAIPSLDGLRLLSAKGTGPGSGGSVR